MGGRIGDGWTVMMVDNVEEKRKIQSQTNAHLLVCVWLAVRSATGVTRDGHILSSWEM
jgi:hypothetical protein